MIEKSEYQGFPNCLRITNGEAEIVVTTDVGPRILSYRFASEENIFGWHPEAKVETTLGEFRPYGGHRLWMAPEHMPKSYAPDNSSVEYQIENDLSARLTPEPEPVTKIQKEMTVTLDAEGAGVTVHHRIFNRGTDNIQISAWGLTIMQSGGVCEVPQEPYRPYGPDTLLPVRSLSFWSYTDLTDPRWQIDRELIRLHVDESIPEPQKIGVMNRQGWVTYRWKDLRFVKRAEFIENEVYPDMNSSTELYTAGSFVEVETLSPLKTLAPGEAVEHTENWELSRIDDRDVF